MLRSPILTIETMQEELTQLLINYEDEDWRSTKIESMSLSMCKALLNYSDIFVGEMDTLSKPHYEKGAIELIKSLGYNFKHDFSPGFYEDEQKFASVHESSERHKEIVRDFTEIKEQITRLKFEIFQQKEFLEKGNEIKVVLSTTHSDVLSEANKLTLEALERNSRLSEQLKIQDIQIAEHTQTAKQFVAKSYSLEKRVEEFSAKYQATQDLVQELSDRQAKLSEELTKKQLYMSSLELSLEALTKDSNAKNEMINQLTQESGVMKDRLDRLARDMKINNQEKKPKLKMFGR